MQTASTARKIRVLIDKVEIPGLVRFGEVALETQTIDVPTYNRIVKIQSGIVAMPEVTLSYETRRDADTRPFFKNWWKTKGPKEFQIYAVDAEGRIDENYDTTIWEAVEIRRLSEPEFDAANPTYARIDITVLPYDIVTTSMNGS